MPEHAQVVTLARTRSDILAHARGHARSPDTRRWERFLPSPTASELPCTLGGLETRARSFPTTSTEGWGGCRLRTDLTAVKASVTFSTAVDVGFRKPGTAPGALDAPARWIALASTRDLSFGPSGSHTGALQALHAPGLAHRKIGDFISQNHIKPKLKNRKRVSPKSTSLD